MNYAEKMMGIIRDQLLSIMESDPEYYSKYDIILSNEQQYVKTEERKPKAIYIVVKFMSSTVMKGQTMVPVNINAIGEENAIEVCQRLLLEYAQTFTMSDEIAIEEEEDRFVIKQIWQSPQIMSNFNVVMTGFRSLFYMSGTFLVGKNSLPITGITIYSSPNDSTEEGEPVEFLNATWEMSIQLDSQAFYGTNSRTESKSKIGTLGLSMSFYLTESDICKKILGIAFDNQTLAPNGIKTRFYMTIEFADGFTIEKMGFSLIHASATQNIGEFPLISASFTN